jgi:hypothetical protein
LEETFEIEMNESDMMLETSMSDHSTWLQTVVKGPMRAV